MTLSDLVWIYLRRNAVGLAHARGASEVAAVVRSTERAVRAAIHDLRAAGLPVASSVRSPAGFYVPSTREEAKVCSDHLWARVKRIAEVARRFDSSTSVMGLRPANLQQMRLFEDERKVYRHG